jgi:dGTPase
MNPTRAFLDGVLKYKSLRHDLMANGGEAPENHFLYDEQSAALAFVTGGLGFPPAATPGPDRDAIRSIECQIMDWADDTAYSIHDIVDGIHAGFLGTTAIEKWAEAKALDGTAARAIANLLTAIRDGKSEPRMERRIGDFIRAITLVERPGHLANLTNRHRFSLEIDPDILIECRTYKKLAFERVFVSHQLKQLEYKGERMLTEVFAIFASQYLDRPQPEFNLLPPDTAALLQSQEAPNARARRLCDYLAGMTDGFASRTCKRLTDPDFGSIVDLV